jgi:hypothetical protein
MAKPNKAPMAGASAPSEFISAIFSSKVPAGLKLKEYEWENEYRGTVTAFIESGLIKSKWLPGQPGNPKGTVLIGLVDGEMAVLPPAPYPTDDHYDRGFISVRRSTKSRLIVSVYCPKDERGSKGNR